MFAGDQPFLDGLCDRRRAGLLKGSLELVHGDAQRIREQVLLTLLDNAIKHGKGPIGVMVSEADDQVTLWVQDSGPGMPPELCERVFDRFYRGDESRSLPGFGLGLSIAQALIETQQGTIAVDSEVGKGSTFRVTLPRAHQHP